MAVAVHGELSVALIVAFVVFMGAANDIVGDSPSKPLSHCMSFNPWRSLGAFILCNNVRVGGRTGRDHLDCCVTEE